MDSTVFTELDNRNLISEYFYGPKRKPYAH